MPRWRSDSTLNVIKNFNHSKLKYKFPNGDSPSCGFHAARAPLVLLCGLSLRYRL